MADLQKYKPLLHDNPLCGINTYKDTLNLVTGACTRYIKKLVLTGNESGWTFVAGSRVYLDGDFGYALVDSGLYAICSHFTAITPMPSTATSVVSGTFAFRNNISQRMYFKSDATTSAEAWVEYLAQQYAAGTPVTIWYVLSTPTTETITVPSGLSGTEEGYLTQSETPTPTNPVYPTANEVLIWQHSIRKLTTATDTITTLPADVYADGNNATVGLKGNTVQNGTPTPDNPIMPQGTGERTGNLLLQKLTGANIDSSGKILSDANYDTYIAEVSGGETYTVSNVTGIQVFGFFTTKPTLGAITYNSSRTIFSTSSQTLTVPTGENIKYISVRYNAGVSNAMLNVGSAALPYEPYGYKIPISSANTTTPVYLGEVETTRKIKKLVLTGEEVWIKSESRIGNMYTQLVDAIIPGFSFCDRAVNARSLDEFSSSGKMFVESNNRRSFLNIWLFDTAISVDDFKSYLASQYSAGTPVVVWYVLGTPETGIVNEQLMKIGNYADTVSGITVPTITGKDSFDVDTTLKPSEVSLGYTGWHDAMVKEWDGSQWNE